MVENIDRKVVEGFGDEWSRFDQSELSDNELERLFDSYFNIFPWELLNDDAKGFDLGCGSGRWAKLVALRVGQLHLIDPSADALAVAKRNLSQTDNCFFHNAGVEAIPLDDNSCDFGYSLGVLHHIPNTEAGLQCCVNKLKPGAPFLLYLYYRFDNRPLWFKMIWQSTDLVRRFVSRLPHSLRFGVSQVLAAVVYFPLARLSLILEKMGLNVKNLPLSQYRHTSFYVMRTDALDRFGTRLEQRFTRKEIEEMMTRVGLENIKFSQTSFWTAVGIKK
jgi:SAM-dependent methyltransferase